MGNNLHLNPDLIKFLNKFPNGAPEHEAISQIMYSRSVLTDAIEIFNTYLKLLSNQLEVGKGVSRSVLDNIDKLSLALSDIDNNLKF